MANENILFSYILLQCSAVQCSAVQCGVVYYSVVQWSAVKSILVQWKEEQCIEVLCNAHRLQCYAELQWGTVAEAANWPLSANCPGTNEALRHSLCSQYSQLWATNIDIYIFFLMFAFKTQFNLFWNILYLTFLFYAFRKWSCRFLNFHKRDAENTMLISKSYERVQLVGLISLSCNWAIWHNEIDQM